MIQETQTPEIPDCYLHMWLIRWQGHIPSQISPLSHRAGTGPSPYSDPRTACSVSPAFKPEAGTSTIGAPPTFLNRAFPNPTYTYSDSNPTCSLPVMFLVKVLEAPDCSLPAFHRGPQGHLWCAHLTPLTILHYLPSVPRSDGATALGPGT